MSVECFFFSRHIPLLKFQPFGRLLVRLPERTGLEILPYNFFFFFSFLVIFFKKYFFPPPFSPTPKRFTTCGGGVDCVSLNWPLTHLLLFLSHRDYGTSSYCGRRFPFQVLFFFSSSFASFFFLRLQSFFSASSSWLVKKNTWWPIELGVLIIFTGRFLPFKRPILNEDARWPSSNAPPKRGKKEKKKNIYLGARYLSN